MEHALMVAGIGLAVWLTVGTVIGAIVGRMARLGYFDPIDMENDSDVD